MKYYKTILFQFHGAQSDEMQVFYIRTPKECVKKKNFKLSRKFSNSEFRKNF